MHKYECPQKKKTYHARVIRCMTDLLEAFHVDTIIQIISLCVKFLIDGTN